MTVSTAEIQAVRMRKGESVIEFYGRIKSLIEGAKASLKETFENAHVPNIELILKGIAFESFKRGLSDDLFYGVSVQAPATIESAIEIAQRI